MVGLAGLVVLGGVIAIGIGVNRKEGEDAVGDEWEQAGDVGEHQAGDDGGEATEAGGGDCVFGGSEGEGEEEADGAVAASEEGAVAKVDGLW